MIRSLFEQKLCTIEPLNSIYMYSCCLTGLASIFVSLLPSPFSVSLSSSDSNGDSSPSLDVESPSSNNGCFFLFFLTTLWYGLRSSLKSYTKQSNTYIYTVIYIYIYSHIQSYTCTCTYTVIYIHVLTGACNIHTCTCTYR